MPQSAQVRVTDPLSDVVSALNLRGTVIVRTQAGSGWGISFPRGNARFHVLERGALIATVGGLGKPIHAVAGDLLLFPHGEHTITDNPAQKSPDLAAVVKKGWDAEARVLRIGQGKAQTRMICGAFQVDRSDRNALLAALPPVLHVPGRSGRPTGQLELVLQIFLTEVNGGAAGSALCSARLVDMIFILAIRDWLAKESANVAGWLGAMRDPHVGAALSKLHGDPAYPWTVSELSEHVGLSRSPFAARFTALVGEPPLRYLTRWRMHIARQLLQRGVSVREAAERVGYESEAAFSRTFKRYLGKAPVKFRAGSRADEESP